MKARFNYKSRKTIIITIAIIVLLALSATGVYVFTKGNDNAEAFTEGNTTIEGSSQNNEGEGTTLEGEQTGEPNEGLENNGEQTVIDTPTTGETTTEEVQQGATNNEGTTNNVAGTTTSTTAGNVPNQEYVTERQEEVETLVYEGFLVGWTPISVASLTDDISLNKVESNVAYTVEKVATLVNGESLERDEDGKVITKVKPGDTVTYIITVKNTGNVTLQNINVVDELVKGDELINILKDETIKVLAIGDTKEITVEYKVNQNDMDENEEITNTVRATTEDPTDPEKEIEENNDEIVPVNPYITISGTKTWVDYNNQENTRPDSIKIEILNGETVVDTIETTAAKEWKYTSKELPKYADKNATTAIEYTVREVAVSGYTTTYNGKDVTNTLKETPKTQITVSKVWNDGNNQDNNRPTSVKVQLFVEGVAQGNVVTLTEVDNKLQTVANIWQYTFENLDKYNSNNEIINYEVREVNSNNNVIEANGTDGDYTVSYEKDVENKVMTITNSYTPQKVNGDGKIAVTKVWENDTEDTRQDVTIKLTAKANNATVEGVSGKTLTLTAKNNWRGEFTDLPKYANGKEISYTISENPIEGYDTNITGSVANGFIVTNTHKSAPQLEIVKKAIDSNGNEITNVEYNPENGSYEFTYRISVKNTVQNSYPATIPAQTITDNLSQLTEQTYENGGVEIISATATSGTINSDYKTTKTLTWNTAEISTTEQHLDIKVKVTADAFEKTSQGTENLISSMNFSTSTWYFIDENGKPIESDYDNYKKINDTDGTVNIFLRTKNTTNKNNGYIYAGTVDIGNTKPNGAMFATTNPKYQGDNADDNINKALQNTSTAINLAKNFEINKSIISKYFVNNTLPTISEIANNVNSLYGGDITIDTENQVIIWYKVVNTADARLKRTYTIDGKTRTVQLEECSYHLDGIIVDKKDLGMDINDGTTVQISNTIEVTVPEGIKVERSLTSNVTLTYKKPTLTNN